MNRILVLSVELQQYCLPGQKDVILCTAPMADHSESESEDPQEVDWASLEEQLSAGALEGLRQHVQMVYQMETDVFVRLFFYTRYNR